MRILITGSRDWEDRSIIRAAILNELMSQGGVQHTIIHGGALGADSMADSIAREVGLTVECHPADWTTHGKKAGFIRNTQMVESGADVCLAFIKNESRGATMCADIAERNGIRTARFTN